MFIENEGNQRLTHSQVGYGSLAVARQGSNPSLPAGATIVSATLNFETANPTQCTIAAGGLGALCDLGQFDAGENATARFVVNAPSVAVATTTYASFKVAENVPDQGANRNTFFADANLDVGATNSNSNATWKTGGSRLLAVDGRADPGQEGLDDDDRHGFERRGRRDQHLRGRLCPQPVPRPDRDRTCPGRGPADAVP